ncbi:hypothetical protein [Rhodovulum sp. P5]|uniref:hypothetical protein n=1 Tax=Rhodovulum sp. P5 TaxID=1564506 RepID=UPI00155FC38B|nr:hypothetical protein [Rhodovulum sp. P5]
MKNVRLGDTVLLVVTLCLTALTVPVTLLMAGPAKVGRPALVVAAPWGGGAAAVIADAGGQEVGPYIAPMARFAVFTAPDRAVQAGAWAVLDADALLTLCGFEREPV